MQIFVFVVVNNEHHLAAQMEREAALQTVTSIDVAKQSGSNNCGSGDSGSATYRDVSSVLCGCGQDHTYSDTRIGRVKSIARAPAGAVSFEALAFDILRRCAASNSFFGLGKRDAA